MFGYIICVEWIVQNYPSKKQKGQSQNLYMNFLYIEERFLKLCEMKQKIKVMKEY